MILGDLMGALVVERLASGGLGTGRFAWLTTCQILTRLCYFSFFVFGGALCAPVESTLVFSDVDFYFYFFYWSECLNHSQIN